MTLAAGRVGFTDSTRTNQANRPVLHPRICAAVTAASCFAHLWLAVVGHHGAWLNVLMVALAAVCLPCALHIWRHGHVRSLHKVTASAVAMVAVHAVLLIGAGHGGHVHGSSTAAAPADSSGAAGLLAVIALELTTAILAATLVARLRGRLATTAT